MSGLLFLEYSSPLRIYGDTNHIAQINRQHFYLDPAIPGLVDRRILVAIGGCSHVRPSRWLYSHGALGYDLSQ